eukprot:10864114-Prorocentrum_lima.AAC.1
MPNCCTAYALLRQIAVVGAIPPLHVSSGYMGHRHRCATSPGLGQGGRATSASLWNVSRGSPGYDRK